MRRLVFIALFAGITVALGLLFLAVPNLELVTMTCFLAGYFLGVRDGVIAAAMGEGLYSLLNPLGAAAPPMLAAQIVGVSLAALAGSFSAQWPFDFFKFSKSSVEVGEVPVQMRNRTHPWKNRFASWKIAGFFALSGLLVTLVFDFLTTLSFTIFVGETVKVFVTSLVVGLPFYLMHIGSNVLIFALVVPVLISRLNTWFRPVLEKGR